MSPPAASTLAKFFPVEVAPVVAPVVLAAFGFVAILGHTFVSDPELDKGHAPLKIDDADQQKRGESHRNSWRGYFTDRIKSRAVGIFDNGHAI